MVFQSVRNYVYDRRRGIAKIAGFVGGVYLVGQYALQRLEEVREKILQDRLAKENLKRRFTQNQEDCVFTTLALVPTLGNQILEELDVESLTLQLQQHGSNKPPTAPLDQSLSSISSSVLEDTTPVNVHPEIPPLSIQKINGNPSRPQTPVEAPGEDQQEIQTEPQAEPPSETEVKDVPHEQDANATDDSQETLPAIESSQTWVQEFAASQAGSESDDESDAVTALDRSPSINADMPLSESVMSEDSPSMVIVPGAHSSEGVMDSSFTKIHAPETSPSPATSVILSSPTEPFRRSPAPSPSPPPLPQKSKLELWKELKLTTFTRSLTILYSLVLLTLTTHVQLNILASHKYVQSVVDLEEEETSQEKWSGPLGMPGGGLADMLFGAGSGPPGGELYWGETDDEYDARDAAQRRKKIFRISDMTNRKYLTMSWWLLNVGWKSIMSKVEAAVEEVIGGIPLKAQLSVEDLRLHLDLVRQKVEHETSLRAEYGDDLSPEEQAQLQGVPSGSNSPGPAPRTDFLPSLLPLTRAAEQHVLVEGGIPPETIFAYGSESAAEEESFRALLDETKSFLSSKDFEIVFDKAITWALGVFLHDLKRDLFTGEEEETDDPEGSTQTKKLRLAALLPGVTSWSHLTVNSIPNELIEGIANLPEVGALSAIIFASYEDR